MSVSLLDAVTDANANAGDTVELTNVGATDTVEDGNIEFFRQWALRLYAAVKLFRHRHGWVHDHGCSSTVGASDRDGYTDLYD